MNLYKPDRSLPGSSAEPPGLVDLLLHLELTAQPFYRSWLQDRFSCWTPISFTVILVTTPPPGGDQRRVSLRGVETKENHHQRHAADSQVEVLLSHPVISVYMNASASTCSTCLYHTSAVLLKIILSN